MNIEELNKNIKEIDTEFKEVKLSIADYIRINYDYLVDDVIYKLKAKGLKPYEVLASAFQKSGYEKVSAINISRYIARIKRERELLGKEKRKSIVPTSKDLFYKNQEKINQLARLDNSTLISSMQSQNNVVKGVTPTLEVQPGVEGIAPQSMALPESKSAQMVGKSQIEGIPPSIRSMSRDESIHMEIPPGLTAQEGEMVKKWYDISWMGEEPDWSVVLKEEYVSKLNMETWDDEKENLWRHIFKLCREKYGMTESEMTTATYFERKATKDIATLRSKLAFIRARKATKYQLNIYTIGKKTRKSS